MTQNSDTSVSSKPFNHNPLYVFETQITSFINYVLSLSPVFPLPLPTFTTHLDQSLSSDSLPSPFSSLFFLSLTIDSSVPSDSISTPSTSTIPNSYFNSDGIHLNIELYGSSNPFPVSSSTQNIHSMLTRAKNGTYKHKEFLTTIILPEP